VRGKVMLPKSPLSRCRAQASRFKFVVVDSAERRKTVINQTAERVVAPLIYYR
jgi:hypothetical protein